MRGRTEDQDGGEHMHNPLEQAVIKMHHFIEDLTTLDDAWALLDKDVATQWLDRTTAEYDAFMTEYDEKVRQWLVKATEIPSVINSERTRDLVFCVATQQQALVAFFEHLRTLQQEGITNE